MPDNSFDVVSKIEMPEVLNAVQQALKEVQQRFDLKDTHSNIELNEKESKLVLASKDEFKLKAVIDILESKLVKRKVPLKGLQFGEIIPSAGSTVKQEITLQQGIAIEKAREIVKKIKDSKLKVQASIQGDFENLRHASIIHFDLKNLRAGITFRKFENVLEVRAAPRVNRLRVVAHDHEVFVIEGQRVDEIGLDLVRVLIF